MAREPIDLEAETPATTARAQSLKNITTAVYALQAVGLVFGLTFIAAVVINYIKRDEVEGTWLAPHFRWQLRTFWYGLAWSVVGVLTAFILIGQLVLLVNLIWLIYRITKGWLNLSDGRSPYPPAP